MSNSEAVSRGSTTLHAELVELIDSSHEFNKGS
jgi:hypothetical protein